MQWEANLTGPHSSFRNLPLVIKFIPCFQNKVVGAVFVVLLLLLFFEDAKGFAGKVWAIYVLRIENIAKFVTCKTMSIPNYRRLTLLPPF